jgi:hypothetical protein
MLQWAAVVSHLDPFRLTEEIAMNRNMKIKKCLALAGLLAAVLATARAATADKLGPKANLPIAPGPFKPTWESLKQYECPEWFRDAKFGIWAHWSAQCVPEDGDWYARGVYEQGSGHYKYHVEHYGHPSKVGFKDICNLWKAEKWDPEKLIQLYKRAGAKYFVALANHHCNFSLGWPDKSLTIHALAKGSPLVAGDVAEVRLLGHDGKLDFSRSEDGLTINLPEKKPCDYAVAFKITGLKPVPGAEPAGFNAEGH